MPQSLINPEHLCFHTGTHKPGSITALQSVCSANLAVGAKGSTVFSGTGGEKRVLAFPQQDVQGQRRGAPKTRLFGLIALNDNIPIQNRWLVFA